MTLKTVRVITLILMVQMLTACASYEKLSKNRYRISVDGTFLSPEEAKNVFYKKAKSICGDKHAVTRHLNYLNDGGNKTLSGDVTCSQDPDEIYHEPQENARQIIYQ